MACLNNYILAFLIFSLVTATATQNIQNFINSLGGDGDPSFQGTPMEIVNENKEDFFVITTIFNPATYQSRYDLYHNFVRHMKDTNAQLITIECIFPTLNQHAFQVTHSDNPFHIQLRSESVYWMKENLINIAVSRLPSQAKWIAWLDADIEFHDKNWIDLTLEALKNYSVVQMFETAEFLGPDKISWVTYRSFGYCVVHGKPIIQNSQNKWYPHPGYGFAMSVDTFHLINGLPEFYIVGGGDRIFALSLLDKLQNEEFWLRNLHPNFFKLLKRRTSGIFNNLRAISKSIFGYVPVAISHHWHGAMKDRQYRKRYIIISAHNFNYETNVKKSPEGLLVLTDNNSVCARTNYWNRRNMLQEDIVSFFRRRNEDQ